MIKFNEKTELPETYRPPIVRVCSCTSDKIALFQKRYEETYIVACTRCNRRSWAADDYRAAWDLWNEKIFTISDAEKWVERNGKGGLTQVKL